MTTMPATARQISASDLMSDTEFSKVRKERRAALLPIKRLRRVHLGPHCTFYFECYDTMLFQIQEMLLIEKGGAAQIPDELAAYNPLVPQGRELIATIMFEVEDPFRRAEVLARLGGVEDLLYVKVGETKIFGLADGDEERTRDDGKTSAVHFLHFPLAPEQIAQFRDPATTIMIGSDHESYAHMALLSPATRAELARDFS
jgi:hypothetical protein